MKNSNRTTPMEENLARDFSDHPEISPALPLDRRQFLKLVGGGIVILMTIPDSEESVEILGKRPTSTEAALLLHGLRIGYGHENNDASPHHLQELSPIQGQGRAYFRVIREIPRQVFFHLCMVRVFHR